MGQVKVERGIVKYYLDRVHCLSSITDTEEKHSFILNTFLAFQKDGWKIALHPQVCWCLEELITHANVECITVLLKILSKNWARIINSKFAYHVLHKALFQCQTFEYHADELIIDYVQSFCTHMKENLSVYLTDSHATHTCRIYPQILAGVRLEKDKTTNTFKSNVQLVTAYDENYIESLTQLCKEFLFTKALKNHVVNECLCPFIQVLLLVASVRLSDVFVKKFKKIMKYSGLFITNLEENNLIERYLGSYTNPVASYFAELLVEVMPGANFADFLNSYILSNCAVSLDCKNSNPITLADLLMSNPTASRVLRAVIRRLTKPVDIKNFFTVIQSCKSNKFGLRSIIPNKQYGILTDLADLCIRHPSEEFQRTFLRMLPTIFGFIKKDNSICKDNLFIRCLIGMITLNELNDYINNQSIEHKVNVTTEDDSDDNKNKNNQHLNSEEDLINPVSLPGCLFVITLFKFTYAYPMKVIISLLSQSSKCLTAWAQHNQLSRVLEAFISSESIMNERKITLFKSLMNSFTVLACDPNGSHIVEAFLTVTNTWPQSIMYKELIAEQLNPIANQLQSHKYGHFIYMKLSLELYRNNKTLWLTRNKSNHTMNNSNSNDKKNNKNHKRPVVEKLQDSKRPRKSLA
ncbi:unnamed protein product [Schistosoma turkestanicum]|nr:unnamed protein product [Schistosoma turkestanicum]